jgi:hypothetical protein
VVVPLEQLIVVEVVVELATDLKVRLVDQE